MTVCFFIFLLSYIFFFFILHFLVAFFFIQAFNKKWKHWNQENEMKWSEEEKKKCKFSREAKSNGKSICGMSSVNRVKKCIWSRKEIDMAYRSLQKMEKKERNSRRSDGTVGIQSATNSGGSINNAQSCFSLSILTLAHFVISWILIFLVVAAPNNKCKK